MLWLSGCFFVLAALTRQMAPVYVAGVVLLVGYMFAINLLGDMENKTLAALVDPSGATAFDVLARYWSVAQKNAQEIPFAGELAVESRAVAGRRDRRDARGLRRVSHAGRRACARAQAQGRAEAPAAESTAARVALPDADARPARAARTRACCPDSRACI